MKRIVLIVGLMMAFWSAGAQNCYDIVLPRFHFDTAWMATYPQGKIDYLCAYAQAAFYESDTIPTGANVMSINQVQDKHTGEYLSSQYVVNLNTLSYYAYNFEQMQLQITDREKEFCFTTPASAHPYLVLRSLNGMMRYMEAQERGE